MIEVWRRAAARCGFVKLFLVGKVGEHEAAVELGRAGWIYEHWKWAAARQSFILNARGQGQAEADFYRRWLTNPRRIWDVRAGYEIIGGELSRVPGGGEIVGKIGRGEWI